MSQTDILYIVLAAVVAVALAFFMYGFRSKISTQRKWFFGSLRFLTLFVVLLLIINPKIENTTYQIVKPKLSIVTDNSKSINYLEKTEEVLSFTELLQSNTAIQERFDVDVYQFDDDITTLDSIDFKGIQTNIYKALTTVAQLHKTKQYPLVLITDGNATYGNAYSYLSDTYQHPVYTVAVGDTTGYNDLTVSRVNTNRYAYIKNEFPVEVFVNYNGNSQVTTTLKVSRGNRVVYTEPLTFSAGTQSKTVNFHLPADRVGVQQYDISVDALADERHTDNNVRPFAVEVIDNATNILLVSAISHPDIGALQRAIASNEQRRVTLTTPDKAMAAIEDTQLVILYQPDARFQQFNEAIDRIDLNTLYITGLHTDWRFVNEAQDDFYKRISYPEEVVQAKLNTGYAAFAVEDIGFSNFPPLHASLGNFESTRPLDVLLSQQVQGIDTEAPLLFSMEFQGRKTAVFDAENIWKWRAYSYTKTGDFISFDNFFGNFIQYLSSNKRRTRLEVTSKSFYNSTDAIKIYAQYFDKNFVFDSRASLEIAIKNTDLDQLYRFPMLLKNNYFEVNLSSLPAGSYEYTVEAVGENTSKSGVFEIIAYDVEKQFLNPDVNQLTLLSEKTSGKTYFLAQSQSLIDDLLGDNRFVPIEKSIQKTVPLVDWKVLLFVLIVLLSIEWFSRKYSGWV